VFAAKLPRPAADFKLAPVPGLNIKNGGGMAFTDSNHFYIASRTENFIRKFDENFHAMKFECDLPDNPEFLMHL
jgi:hypothetical protein